MWKLLFDSLWLLVACICCLLVVRRHLAWYIQCAPLYNSQKKNIGMEHLKVFNFFLVVVRWRVVCYSAISYNSPTPLLIILQYCNIDIDININIQWKAIQSNTLLQNTMWVRHKGGWSNSVVKWQCKNLAASSFGKTTFFKTTQAAKPHFACHQEVWLVLPHVM